MPSGAAKLSRGGGGGTGKDPDNISHGRASGRLHYHALDTKISSNEKPGQFTSFHRSHHLPASESMKCIASILRSTCFYLLPSSSPPPKAGPSQITAPPS